MSDQGDELSLVSQVARDLIAYVRSFLPLDLIDDEDSDRSAQLLWMPVRLADTLESVLVLGSHSLHLDAAALVRVMIDHLITFAWLVADEKPPTRLNRWKKRDVALANKASAELATFGIDSEELSWDAHTTIAWPGVQQAAQECDRFWTPFMRPILREGTVNSFSALYSGVFRGASSYTHPSIRGGLTFFTTPKNDPTGGRAFRINRSYSGPGGTYAQATTILLLAACVVAARFRPQDVATVLKFVDAVAAWPRS